MYDNQTRFQKAIKPYLQAIAAAGTYGGGSAAAALGAIGVGLVRKAVVYSAAKKERETAARLSKKIPVLRSAEDRLLTSVDADAELFQRYLNEKDIQMKAEALRKSSEDVCRVLQACQEVVGVIRSVHRSIHPHIFSDAVIGLILIESACAASFINLRVNNRMQKMKALRISLSIQKKKIVGIKKLRKVLEKEFNV